MGAEVENGKPTADQAVNPQSNLASCTVPPTEEQKMKKLNVTLPPTVTSQQYDSLVASVADKVSKVSEQYSKPDKDNFDGDYREKNRELVEKLSAMKEHLFTPDGKIKDSTRLCETMGYLGKLDEWASNLSGSYESRKRAVPLAREIRESIEKEKDPTVKKSLEDLRQSSAKGIDKVSGISAQSMYSYATSITNYGRGLCESPAVDYNLKPYEERIKNQIVSAPETINTTEKRFAEIQGKNPPPAISSAQKETSESKGVWGTIKSWFGW